MTVAGKGVKSLLIGAIVLLGATSVAARKIETPAIPKAPPPAYTVLPFANEAGVSTLSWMRVGLPGALAEMLAVHKGLRSTHGPLLVPDPPPSDADPLAVVARQAKASGARFVFAGSFRRPDWKLEITLRLYDVQGGEVRAVGEATRRGDFGRAFEMLADLSLALLGQAGIDTTEEVEKAVRRPPTGDHYAFTLYGRGLEALHGVGDRPNLERALKTLERTVFIDPRYAEAHRLLAIVYEGKNQGARARGQLEYALNLRPDYYLAMVALLEDAYARRCRDEGIPLAVNALKLRPWDLRVRHLLGEMLWQEGDIEGAFRELKRITTHDPDHIDARRSLVLVHAARGDNEGLAKELEEILRLSPDDVAARLDLGAAYHSLGNDNAAIHTYQQVVRAEPGHLLALKFLGDIYKARGDIETAAGYYELALKANKGDPRPYFLLGSTYVEAGNYEKALRIFLMAQKFRRYLAEVYTNLGSIHYRLNRNNRALWYLSRAVKKRPDSATARFNYALALEKKGAREEALRELLAARENDGVDPEIRFQLGVIYLKLGRALEAKSAFEECLSLDAGHEDCKHNLGLLDELERRATEGEIRVE